MSRLHNKDIKPTVATRFSHKNGANSINPTISMFRQDIKSIIMPIGGKTEKHPNFAVALKGNQVESEKAKQLIKKIGNYDSHDLKKVVCNAIDQIALTLSWNGSTAYEIVYKNDKYHIFNFPSEGLWKLSKTFFQLIPRRDWQLLGKKFVTIPANRIWYFEMPPELGGRKCYEMTLKKLRKFDSLAPEFWKKDLERGIYKIDIGQYKKNCDIYQSKVTKKWGWNLRDWSQRNTTEFFTIYRFIRISWAHATLREHIVHEINRLFAQLDISCKLEITGIPSSNNILKINSQLLKGDISFGEIENQVTL